ncbi:Serine/threonine-protein kinase/endoribonuclease [Nymphaea thermarum]|nr:Serine/threonine-protein kinase/endoribonuclease [Nymphaea thermarum]
MACSSVFRGFNLLLFLALLCAGLASVGPSSVADHGEVRAPLRALKALPDADSDVTKAGTALSKSHLFLSEKQLPLIAHLDGDIHFIDLESGRSRWSFKSGPALTSSYRRSVTDGDDNNCSSGLGGKRQSREARLEGDSYMYCGEDWDLYVHSRNKGSMKMPLSPEEFVSALPLISDTGEVILGSKKTTAFLVNERDGKLIHRYGSENDSDGNDDKAIVKVQDDYQENLVLPKERIGAQIQPSTLESVKPIFITRTDYSFTSYAPNKTILWNVTVAAIQATSLCQNSPNGYAGVQDIATGELNRESQDGYKNPFKCQTTFSVSRSHHPKIIRDGVTYLVLDKLLANEPANQQHEPENLEALRLRVLEKHRFISYLQEKASSPYLPAGQWTNKGLEALRALEKNKILHDLQVDPNPSYLLDKGNPLALLPSDEKVKINMLKQKYVDECIDDPYGAITVYEPKFPAVQVEMIQNEVKDPDSRKDVIHMLLAPGFIFFIVIIPLVILLMMFLNIRDRIKQSNSTKKTPVTSKKRKSKKSGNTKNTMMTDMQDKFSSAETTASEVHKHSYIEKIDNESLDGTIKGNQGGGRTIGNLFVSSIEIAKGSNGTVVLQGTFNGRLAAIKRLVLAHSNVASKEVEALLRSDNHPNIVRWYGVEYDPDFVYLALERCACSLGELVDLYAPLSQDDPSFDTYVSNIKSASDSQVELIDRIEGIELWKKNGYPSTQLLGLMRGMVSGLAHLHDLKIIHRDLKPQNVLISAGKPLCAKLSDMGISKSLSDGKSSLTNNYTGAGSSGWQAPELLLGGSQTFALDLFSLGCVLFFCITKGRHPFGNNFERDTNIAKGQPDLSLVEHIPEAVHLFSQLLQPEPSLRPLAHKVLLHPLFWSSEMRLSFLRDSSDRIELEDREKQSDLLEAIECIGPEVFGYNWEIKFDSVFLGSIGNHRRYNANSTRHLLRLIRNKWNHYIEFPKQVQDYLGDMPDGFDVYLTKRFPKLLIAVYKVIYEYCREETYFVKYFESKNI